MNPRPHPTFYVDLKRATTPELGNPNTCSLVPGMVFLVRYVINIYTSQNSKLTHDKSIKQLTTPIIWIKLPFIAKKGSFLLRKCNREISRQLKPSVKSLNHCEITNLNISKRSYSKTLQKLYSV